MTETSRVLPQYQIEQIVSSIKSAIPDMGRYSELISSTIKNELGSPLAIAKFENLLDKYYKSNADLGMKLELFHQTIIKNESQMVGLLEQVIEGSAAECPNNPDLALVREWLDEILHGNEYKMKQQIRDLLESGIARKLRNMVLAYITITALVAALISGVGYLSLYKSISEEIRKESIHHDRINNR